MDNATMELARELVTLPGFRWVPGMGAYDGLRTTESWVRVDVRVVHFERAYHPGDPPCEMLSVSWFSNDGIMSGIMHYTREQEWFGTPKWEHDEPKIWGETARFVPDLDDPATLGCLLALVREAFGDPCWDVLCLGDDAWAIDGSDHPTEAAALVAALREAAP